MDKRSTVRLFLTILQAVLGLNFKTVFANGGAFQPSTYKDFDFIQHLTQESFDEAQQRGIPVEKMTTLTNTITFNEPKNRKNRSEHHSDTNPKTMS